MLDGAYYWPIPIADSIIGATLVCFSGFQHNMSVLCGYVVVEVGGVRIKVASCYSNGTLYIIHAGFSWSL